MGPAMVAGHPRVEWLAVAEARTQIAAEVMAPFPSLRAFAIRDTDRLRRLGSLGEHAPALRTLGVDVVGLRSLDGIERVPALESLGVWSSPIVDIDPIRALRGLRALRLRTPRLTTIEAIRGCRICGSSIWLSKVRRIGRSWTRCRRWPGRPTARTPQPRSVAEPPGARSRRPAPRRMDRIRSG